MSTLNVLNKSPFEKKTMEQCLARLADGDSVLMIEDAVVAALADTAIASQLESVGAAHALYVLEPDLAARGLSSSSRLAAVKVVDYSGFVELATTHERVHSWL